MATTANNAPKTGGIDFARTFGSRMNVTDQTNTSRKDLPKADVWINIGVATGDETYPFISLPMGIPLDTMEPLAVRGNDDFRQFTSARNDLLAQLQEAAAGLEPGTDMIIETEGGLAIQVRRVAAEVAEAPIEENRFAVNLGFKRAA